MLLLRFCQIFVAFVYDVKYYTNTCIHSSFMFIYENLNTGLMVHRWNLDEFGLKENEATPPNTSLFIFCSYLFLFCMWQMKGFILVVPSLETAKLSTLLLYLRPEWLLQLVLTYETSALAVLSIVGHSACLIWDGKPSRSREKPQEAFRSLRNLTY